MRLKITIILLLLCLLFLCAFCFTAKSLITNKYDAKPVKLIKSLSKTQIVQYLINRYNLTGLWDMLGMKDPDKSNLQEMEKKYFELARLIFIRFAVVMVCVISLALIIIYCTETKPSLSPQKYTIFFILLLIVLNGTIIRLMMARAYYGNYDMHSCEMVTDIVTHGGNVYAQTERYNYSPIWFTILSFLKYVQIQLPSLPFHFVVRAFLCIVDLVTLVFLLLIAHHKKISLPKIAMLFYLSPVSFLLTGYHGQIENLAILMIIIGLFIYLKLSQKPIWGTAILWLFATAGMVIKHNVFYELIICLNAAIKRYQIKFLLFLISVCFFLALFIPYWNSGKEGIIRNVFMYSSGVGMYGITSLFNLPQLKYLFIIGLFVFPLFLKNRDIIQQCLLGMLFFLTFTSGIAIQYFVLPIAIGSLYPSKGFLFYSLAASVFILGNSDNLFVPGFHLFGWNVVWVGATYWFFSELMRSKQIKATEEAIQKSPKRKNLKG
jgi:hypothetical protein